MIDSHQHFWALARGDYAWITPELSVLNRDYGPKELADHLNACGIDKTITVQAAPTIEETHYLLSLAGEHDYIAAVIGWVDLESPQAANDIALLAAHPKLKGIRPMARDYRGSDWLSDPILDPALEALTKHGLRFEALAKEPHLASLAAMMDRHRDLPVVINHGAKPDIRSGWSAAWADAVAELAEHTSAYCKFSGLVTETDEPDCIDDIAPVFDHLHKCFGAERLMWGSDWPVLNLVCTYEDWLSMTMQLLEPLSQADRFRIMGGNAAEFYGLQEH